MSSSGARRTERRETPWLIRCASWRPQVRGGDGGGEKKGKRRRRQCRKAGGGGMCDELADERWRT